MAISVTCPGCQSVYPVPETLAGKTIRCKKCGEMMPVTAPQAAAPPAAAPVAARPARPVARVLNDDEDSIHSPKAAAVVRRARDEDEDYDDAPRARPAGKPDAKKKSPLLLILGGVVAVLVLMGGAVAVAFGTGLIGGKSGDDEKTVAQGGEGGQPPSLPKVPADWASGTKSKGDGESAKGKAAEGTGAVQPPSKSGGNAPLVIDPLKPAGQPPVQANNTSPSRPFRDSLDPITLNKCKAATVFFDVEGRNGSKWSGSGWFGLEPNLIFTNAHVVGMKSRGAPKPAKMTVYLNPGTAKQREIPHSRLEILAVDREADLAVVKVLNETDLPSPLQTRPSAELPELEKAIILGFPGGYTLSRITKSDKQPAVTVNPSSVGAVRRDSFGNLSGVQFRGGSAPGGSGGPIVDTDGNVIAVLFMGPAEAVLASAACYGVPTEYVTGLIAGRVADVEYGQPFRKDGKVHIPVTAHCLDPFQRLKSVGVASWVGDNNTRTRPPGAQRTGMEPSDSDYSEVALTYKHSKDDPVATGELVLPELPAGRSYWAQPYYSNALVSQQWQAGNPIKLTGPPVDLEPADLIVRYKPGTKRTLTLSNSSSLDEFEEGDEADKSERVLVEVEITANEQVQRPTETGAHATLLLNYEKLALKGQIGSIKINDGIPKELRGLLQEGIKQVQGLAQVNRDGEIYKTLSNVRATGQFAPLFKTFSDETLESLQASSIKLPNTKAQPGFTWKDTKTHYLQLVFFDGSELLPPSGGPGGGRPRGPSAQRQPRSKEFRYQQEIKYTYLGSRVRGGQKEAVVKIEGTISTPPGAPAGSGASGVFKGYAYIDLDTGTVIQAEVEKELEIDTSANNVKKRVSGINKYKLTRGSAITG
jgi:S1-C subfamily serine protease